MKKRILSILLAVALLLSVGVVPARAADSCVSVKADAATTAEVVAGDLLEIPLGDIFRDSDGHSLTYTLVNAAQFGTQTKVGGSTLYVSEKDPGTYEPKIKATCSGGKSVTATLTVTVKPAPHGLDAQYNYDESPAKEVTVYVTISNDGVPIRGRDGTILCHKAITVPYFDLSQYGLDEFYRYHTANGEGKYVDNNIVERPTGLHLYIYLLERYFIGLPESQCCKGRYDRGGLEGFRLDDDVYYMDEDPAYTASLAALKITGSPTSLYMANFWGHDENLMYYRNHCYPYMSPGWGSTSDYILLSDGDTWDVAMFTNWSFYSSGGAFTCFDKDAYTVRPGTELTVTSKAYGTYTVPSVNGNVTVTSTKTPKSFSVTLGDDTTGEATATYTKDYIFTLTPASGYTYNVTVTIGGKTYTNYTPVVNENGTTTYTIPGADVTGDIVINSNKAVKPAQTFSVSFTGTGASDAKGASSVTENAAYTFTVDKKDNFEYTVSATMGGKTVAVTEGENGSYTIAKVTGNLVITVEKKSVSTMNVAVSKFVEMDNKTVFLVTVTGTPEEGKAFAYGENVMYKTTAYGENVYSWLVIVDGTDLTAADAEAKITQSAAEAEEVAAGYDVNETGVVDINDAQLTYDLYTGKYTDFETVSVRKFLRADTNADKVVNSADAVAVVANSN